VENIKDKFDFIRIFHFSCNCTELNMKEISQYYDCTLQLFCYLNCLSVRSLHTHYEHRQNLEHFYFFLCQTNATHCTPSISGFRHKCREADCFQATPTLLTNPQYVCIILRYQLFFLNMVLLIRFPTQCSYGHTWRLT